MIDDPLRPVLTVYGRPGCHLCEEAEGVLQASLEERVLRGEPVPRVRHVSIAADPDLETRYGALIPVFVVGADQLDLVISRRRLDAFLDRVLPQIA